MAYEFQTNDFKLWNDVVLGTIVDKQTSDDSDIKEILTTLQP
jgi:hypothetical protein